MNGKNTAIRLLILAMIFAGTFSAMAGTGGIMGTYGQAGPGLTDFQDLDLTEEQKTDIASVLNYFHADMTAAVDELQTAKEALTEAIWACEESSFITAAHEKVAEKEMMVVLLQAQIYCEAKTILSDEQTAWLEEHWVERLERAKNRSDTLQAALGKWINAYLNI